MPGPRSDGRRAGTAAELVEAAMLCGPARDSTISSRRAAQRHPVNDWEVKPDSETLVALINLKTLSSQLLMRFDVCVERKFAAQRQVLQRPEFYNYPDLAIFGERGAGTNLLAEP